MLEEQSKMKLKKWMLFCLVAILVLVFSGCGVQLENLSSGTDDSGEDESSEVVVTDEDYEDTLDGLCEYMTAAGYISGDSTEMLASVIGATDGVKYSFSVSSVSVTAEFYAFDLDNLDETGEKTLEDAKNNGKITVLGTEVSAKLSANGKYLLLYADTGKDDFAESRQAAIDAFEAFKS